MFDSGPLAPCYGNVLSSTKQEAGYLMYQNAISCRGGQVMATGNMHKNLARIGNVVLELCKQTDKQIDKLTYSSQYCVPLVGTK